MSLGSSLTAPPGPVRRVRRGPLLTSLPLPRQSGSVQGWDGGSTGEESLLEGWEQGGDGLSCRLHFACHPPPPPFGPLQPLLSFLSLPASHPRSAHVVTLDPMERVLLPLVAQPGAIDTTSVPGCPCWPRRSLFAQAPRQRRSPASCQSVTVRPMKPRRAVALPQPSPAPRHCFLFYSWGAGGSGPWGHWSSCSQSCVCVGGKGSLEPDMSL